MVGKILVVLTFLCPACWRMYLSKGSCMGDVWEGINGWVLTAAEFK